MYESKEAYANKLQYFAWLELLGRYPEEEKIIIIVCSWFFDMLSAQLVVLTNIYAVHKV